MHEEKPPPRSVDTAENSPQEALKKSPGPAKGGREKREARLAAALRENLRRRKAPPPMKNDGKDTD